jgi:hypothetical protein
MNSRPILFSAPMIRAILAGQKTQTRRIIKWRGEPPDFVGGRGEEGDPNAWGWFFDGPHHHGYAVVARGHSERFDNGSVSLPCPYGEPGDQLWVRETWGLHIRSTSTAWCRASIKGRSPDELALAYALAYSADGDSPQAFWRPSIHMPRWASRLSLEVVGVRVERLHQITQADAVAEGIADTSAVWSAAGESPLSDTDRAGPRAGYETLWKDINGAESWDENPWVWVIEFKRAAVSRG